jgi:hypothetical protein
MKNLFNIINKLLEAKGLKTKTENILISDHYISKNHTTSLIFTAHTIEEAKSHYKYLSYLPTTNLF